MKNKDVKEAVAAGKVPEVVALIAYLNSLGTSRYEAKK